MSGAAKCQGCGFTYHLADGCRYCNPAPGQERQAPWSAEQIEMVPGAPRPELKLEIQKDLELIFSHPGQMKLF